MQQLDNRDLDLISAGVTERSHGGGGCTGPYSQPDVFLPLMPEPA